MMKYLPAILFFFISYSLPAQKSDYIIIKKKNNRTVKTYFPGIFLRAPTHSGFYINGYIKSISNDSIYVQQQEIKLMGTEFGSTVDTLFYTIAFHYSTVQWYKYSKRDQPGRKKRFGEVLLPRIMQLGGTGFVVLETVNTVYRKESLFDRKTLTALGIATGVAATGFIWQYFQNHGKTGSKYKVIYVKM